MAAFKARVRNGHIVVEETTDLPEGTELYVVAVDEDEAALERELEASEAELRAGSTVSADDVHTSLRSRQ
jgi:hypothetical protein